MPRVVPSLLAVLLGLGAHAAAAQSGVSLSPTLPSDTLEANYGPRSAPGPTPELAPSLPSDTLEATEPVDSFPTEPFEGDESLPRTPADSSALRELRSWMNRAPGMMRPPPPVRAVLSRV